MSLFLKGMVEPWLCGSLSFWKFLILYELAPSLSSHIPFGLHIEPELQSNSFKVLDIQVDIFWGTTLGVLF
jgi:hypothetical protein